MLDRLLGAHSPEVAVAADPCRDLELAMGAVAGLVETPGQELRIGLANAALRAAGCPQLGKRLSKLGSRRQLAAHPDATLLHDLREALGQLPAGVVERVRADFAKRAEREVVDADRAAGTQWRGSSSSDSGETMEEADDGGAAAGAPQEGR